MKKYVSDINTILKRRNEVSLEADSQRNLVTRLMNELMNDDLTEEVVTADINNIGIFSKVLSIYENRLAELDMLISDYCTLIMNKNRIDSDSYSMLMDDFNKRKDYLLGFVEIDTRDNKTRK